ncbi:hypothetical protein VCR4J5_710052 [Vibrio crassostreae]|uniref:Uncharacterized protein n=1 Tax=Vibrio crassostreae TaxID=246167 RepID=A0A822MMB7_9VIBR|nr:hypothetical protein [Vibrio crassostreae]CDS95583.1 hypothetical protein VCR5J5_1160082 [Vibrio crassostreae]CDT01063.1 hypothetical protein VCR20J5_1100004 [Vibrio crassostreae]CDT02911.1 hypothetical protein VCR15J5_20057 [Vibrio crassostreae]CDT15699.1 hypothetical protein VCR19J5_1290004 [Vibrio crassostreae]
MNLLANEGVSRHDQIVGSEFSSIELRNIYGRTSGTVANIYPTSF